MPDPAWRLPRGDVFIASPPRCLPRCSLLVSHATPPASYFLLILPTSYSTSYFCGVRSLSELFGDAIPYNICRNVEWQVCAAMGRLNGQGGDSIRFAYAPKDLRGDGIGGCQGYAPRGCRRWDDGYASLDVFYMETCLFSQICRNRDSLWSVGAGQDWRCELDHEGWEQLRRWLVLEGMPPHGAAGP